MPNVVLDTNVLVSALLSRSGRSTPSHALALARTHFQLCFSNWMIDEFRGVLLRPKFARYEIDRDIANSFIQTAIAGAVIVNPVVQVADCPDSTDNRILAAALAGTR